jgi:hypothetical protein
MALLLHLLVQFESLYTANPLDYPTIYKTLSSWYLLSQGVYRLRFPLPIFPIKHMDLANAYVIQ